MTRMTKNTNINLNLPLSFGINGANFYALKNQNLTGGGTPNYYDKLDILKQQLNGINQVLSVETDQKLKNRIKKVEELDKLINEDYNKIYEYTKLINNNKIPIINGQEITLSHVNNLIKDYNDKNQKQLKKAMSISTTFGKINFLLEEHHTQSNIQSNKKLNNVYDL